MQNLTCTLNDYQQRECVIELYDFQNVNPIKNYLIVKHWKKITLDIPISWLLVKG